MFTLILTWVGAVLGLTLLIAMAAGTFFVDFDDVRRDRHRKAPDLPEGSNPNTNPKAAPLS